MIIPNLESLYKAHQIDQRKEIGYTHICCAQATLNPREISTKTLIKLGLCKLAKMLLEHTFFHFFCLSFLFYCSIKINFLSFYYLEFFFCFQESSLMSVAHFFFLLSEFHAQINLQQKNLDISQSFRFLVYGLLYRTGFLVNKGRNLYAHLCNSA